MLTLSDSVFVGDLKYLCKKNLANMRGIVHPRSQVVLFFVAKLFYLALSIALPLIFIRLPWWQVLLGYTAVNALVSLVFVFLLIGTHFSTFAEFPPLGADGRLESSWAAHALSTSLDWAPRSRLAAFVAGGGNCHAAHHLFPRVSHIHYRAITKIIRQTAAECGVRYNETTFVGMVASHFAHLRRMGNAGPPLLLRVGIRVPPKLIFSVYRALY
jgi:linoleoyl-CoA desaturase